MLENIDVESRLLDITEISFDAAEIGFEGVDIIIPVFNNNVPSCIMSLSAILRKRVKE